MSDNAQPKLSKDWTYKEVTNIGHGVVYTNDTRLIPDNAFIELENMNPVHGHIHIDYGFAQFADTVRGAMKGIRQFDRTNGTSELIGVTDDTVYKYVQAVDQWQYVSNGTATTLAANASGGATSVNVVSIVGFANGDYIGIILDDGTQHKTQVNGVPAAGSIPILDALPGVGVVASIGNAVVNSVVLSGSDDYAVHTCHFPALDWFIVTNGVDNVKRYNGTDFIDVPSLPSAGNTQCRAVALFNNYLILLNTTEGGTSHPQRARWCDTGDPTVWASGNAGYEDLFDSDDHIVTGLDLGPYLIVYREHSIVRGTFNNTEFEIFAFEPAVSDKGAAGTNSVVKYLHYHIVCDHEEVYAYHGGLSIDELDENIHTGLFGTDGDLEGAQTDKIFCHYSQFLEEVWIFYPKIGDAFPTRVAKYRPEEKSWTFRQLLGEIRTMAEYVSNTDPIWVDLEGDWDAQTWSWSDRASSAGIPSYVFGMLDPIGLVNEITAVYGLTIGDDFGVDIACVAVTKDFGDHRYDIAWDYFDLIFEGTGLEVYYSTDFGETYTLLQNGLVQITPARYRIYFQTVAHYIRFKFQSAGGGIHIESYGFAWRIETE